MLKNINKILETTKSESRRIGVEDCWSMFTAFLFHDSL
jgi:hypothetical protein